MKMTKMALFAGAALAVTTAGAQADDLDGLKAQIEALNARVAAMETAPSVPAGYQLIAVSEGDLQQTPGLAMTARELAAYGTKSTVISVLPTADAPAGATISWSGYARAGLIYTTTETDVVGAAPVPESDDIDVATRGQLRVKASTDTSVGEVGVDIRLRANFNGNGRADVYSDVAWGYWALTPELTLGGGYAGSLGNIGYGYDGACNCYYTDNADVAFNPGDVTQLRLSYASGPVSFAIALEDGSTDGDEVNGDKLGVAGEIKYSGDAFSAEVSAVWRDQEEGVEDLFGPIWQVGAGLGFALGDVANLSLAAALGEEPADADGSASRGPFAAEQTEWWGVSALVSFNVSEEVHTEVAAGYKEREADNFDYEAFGLLGGIYYSPVDQLTIGLEGEYRTTEADGAFSVTDNRVYDTETTQFNLVSVWRF